MASFYSARNKNSFPKNLTNGKINHHSFQNIFEPHKTFLITERKTIIHPTPVSTKIYPANASKDKFSNFLQIDQIKKDYLLRSSSSINVNIGEQNLLIAFNNLLSNRNQINKSITSRGERKVNDNGFSIFKPSYNSNQNYNQKLKIDIIDLVYPGKMVQSSGSMSNSKTQRSLPLPLNNPIETRYDIYRKDAQNFFMDYKKNHIKKALDLERLSNHIEIRNKYTLNKIKPDSLNISKFRYDIQKPITISSSRMQSSKSQLSIHNFAKRLFDIDSNDEIKSFERQFIN